MTTTDESSTGLKFDTTPPLTVDSVIKNWCAKGLKVVVKRSYSPDRGTMVALDVYQGHTWVILRGDDDRIILVGPNHTILPAEAPKPVPDDSDGRTRP